MTRSVDIRMEMREMTSASSLSSFAGRMMIARKYDFIFYVYIFCGQDDFCMLVIVYAIRQEERRESSSCELSHEMWAI